MNLPITNPDQLAALMAKTQPAKQANIIGPAGSRGECFATSLNVTLVDQGGRRVFYSANGEVLGSVPFVTAAQELPAGQPVHPEQQA